MKLSTTTAELLAQLQTVVPRRVDAQRRPGAVRRPARGHAGGRGAARDRHGDRACASRCAPTSRDRARSSSRRACCSTSSASCPAPTCRSSCARRRETSRSSPGRRASTCARCAPRTSRRCPSRAATRSSRCRPRRSSRRSARSLARPRKDETRPILTGILVSASGDELRMVATDSYRLSVKETRLESPLDGGFEANVPARALEELARVVQSVAVDTIEIGVRSNQVVFQAGGDALSSRLIDGQFPNYRQLLPESFEHELHVPGEELAGVVRRISLMAQKNAPLRLAFTEGELTVSAQTPDVGEACEPLPVPFAGEPFEIGFNPDFLRDGLESVGVGRRRAQADQPAAPGPDRGRRRQRLPLPDHADPPERLSDGGGAAATMLVTRLRLRDFRTYATAEVALGAGLTVIHGANGAGKTNLLEALYFGCTGRSCRTTNEREVVRFDAPATPRDRGRARPATASTSSRVGFQPGEAKRLTADGAPVERLLDVAGAPAGERVPARPPRARQGPARRCGARTSTRSSPRCGRRARRRAAPTPRRSPSATRCSAACAPGRGRARRSARGTSSWPATGWRCATTARAPSRCSPTRVRGRRRRSSAWPARWSCATGPRSQRGDAGGARRRAGRARGRATSSAASPATARTATTSCSCATGASCAPSARRASSAWRCWRCCWPSARCSAASAARRRCCCSTTS